MAAAAAGDSRTRVDCEAVGAVADFATLAGEVLELLAGEVGLRLWLVTRVVEGGQLVLVSHYQPESGYGLPVGSVLNWAASLCFQMVAGPGPRVAPRVAEVASYAARTAGLPAPVAAYVGVPLQRSDGALFGTLCGFDPQPQPEELRAAEPLLRVQARLLSTVLAHELDADVQTRRVEHAETEAVTDALTGLANRRGWDRQLSREEARCRRYGHPACVLAIDLDGLKEINDSHGHVAGDELLRRAAGVLRSSARRGDLVARVGGDEFAVLAVEADAAQGARQAQRLRAALTSAGVPAAVGLGIRTPDQTLSTAWQHADHDMYQDKRSARLRPRTQPPQPDHRG